MTHADVIAAIESRGGRLVASFVLDERGDTVGAPSRRTHHCSECGEPGHTLKRCRGKGAAPTPTYDDRRRMGTDWLRNAARAAGDDLAETKGILAARAAERRQARRKR